MRPLLYFLNEESGRLQRLLDEAHEYLARDPVRALALTREAVRFVREFYVPPRWSVCRRYLVGRAWKEHANALHKVGLLKEALAAVRRARNALRGDALASEYASARLLEAQLVGEMGQKKEARAILRECAQTFEELGDVRRAMQTLMMEATRLYRERDYEGAQKFFREALTRAEELHDEVEHANTLNNLGQCEIQLNNLEEGEKYLNGALHVFVRRGMKANLPHILWGFGELQATRDPQRAMDCFQWAADGFRDFGNLTEAARAELRIVEILDQIGERESAMEKARGLIEIFAAAGAQPQLRRVLMYLAAEATPNRFAEAVRTVRDFLAAEPPAEFQLG